MEMSGTPAAAVRPKKRVGNQQMASVPINNAILVIIALSSALEGVEGSLNMQMIST